MVNKFGNTEQNVNTEPKSEPKPELKVGCWNIRRGLIKRELEMTEIMKTNQINLMFLVETDTMMVQTEEDYYIKGYKTIVQKKDPKEKSKSPTRIICLVDAKIGENSKTRIDLMDSEFPSIWVEYKNENSKNVLICGLYREWTKNGDVTQEKQLQSIQILTAQLEAAANEEKEIIVLGDINLCSNKWNNADFLHKTVANELKETLTQCGLVIAELGITYVADRLSKDGETISSALDHIYSSKNLKIKTSKLENSSTDHLPIIAEIKLNIKDKTKVKNKTLIKRSMKNFTHTRWMECLSKQRWESIGETENVNEMAVHLSELMNSALDECAPLTKITIKPGYKSGLTQEAKVIMTERDKARCRLQKSTSPSEKKILIIRYKKMRNKATAQIRKDKITYFYFYLLPFLYVM